LNALYFAVEAKSVSQQNENRNVAIIQIFSHKAYAYAAQQLRKIAILFTALNFLVAAHIKSH
jgi:hypothetical protein